MTKNNSETTDIDIVYSILRTDFISFVEKSFQEIHQGQFVRHGMHILLLCNWLNSVSEGACRRLIINLPPRTLKSFITSVSWVAWELGRHPTKKIIVVTHNQSLARVLADQTRRIMISSWYRATFPKTRIREDFNLILNFQTEAGGGRMALSLETGITGLGGDTVIIDDPINAKDARYENRRKHVNDTFDTAIQSRVNNRATHSLIHVAQRLHEDDLSGHINRKGGFENLIVPLIAEEPKTFKIGNFEWERPMGDILDQESNTPEEVKSLIRDNTSADFQSQYQQDPVPPDGEYIDISWFPRHSRIPQNAKRCIMSWDVGQEVNEGSSFSVCLIFRTDGKHHYLEDIWRGKLEFQKLSEVAEDLIEEYKPDEILIENAALGTALLSVLDDKGHEPVSIPRPSESKLIRLNSHIAKLKRGDVVLPEHHPRIGTFLAELQRFPNGNFDDQVDALTQILAWMKENTNTDPAPAIATGRGPVIRNGQVCSRKKWTPNPQRNPNIKRF
ncbi:MAG: phage terminase large subunit [Rhodospirillaceae bacterium]|nr:phage terminase large subunit [Rhodospirillaceae bacterium]MBT6364106.1 phage terminase large subunit [Rhodospirillaceae bacterium]